MISSENLIYPPGPQEAIELAIGENCLERINSLFHQYGDIYKAYSESRNAYTYVLSNPEMIKHVLVSNNRNYTKGVGIDRVKILLGNGIMSSEGEFWRRQRRMIQPAFHRKVIERLSSEMITANQNMLKTWEQKNKNGEHIELTDELSRVTLQIVLQALFSIDLLTLEQKTGYNPFSIITKEHNRDLQFAMKFRALSSVIRDIIFQRRFQNRNEDDFLSMLMEARDTETGKGMTDKELVDEIMTLIVAGHETTASALNWLWYLLFNHPPAYDKVKKEVDTLQGELPGFHHLSQLSYTKQVIDETLRLYPPGWLLTRRAISDDQIGPYFIPAKTDILISPFVVHRHPAFWNDPDQFDPARFGADQKKERNRFEYFPFAGGPRQCIGDFFAQVEMQLHIALVTQRFELQLIAPDTITLDAQINLRAREPFYATLNPRP